MIGVVYHFLVWDGLDSDGEWLGQDFFDMDLADLTDSRSTCNTRKVH